jgi:hypothetical protein
VRRVYIRVTLIRILIHDRDWRGVLRCLYRI